jgi:hypothetical protein
MGTFSKGLELVNKNIEEKMDFFAKKITLFGDLGQFCNFRDCRIARSGSFRNSAIAHSGPATLKSCGHSGSGPSKYCCGPSGSGPPKKIALPTFDMYTAELPCGD